MAKIGPPDALAKGTVAGAGPWAAGDNGDRFAVSRRCRHLRADLAGGSVDDEGCLVCPWHGARYDVSTGQMVLGPQGAFAKVPGLGAFFKGLTKVVPLKRGRVVERDGELYAEDKAG